MNFSQAEAKLSLELIESALKCEEPESIRLKRVCAVLFNVRARVLTNSLRPLVKDKVHGGPFKGMALTEDAMFGYRPPIILGCYEQELHSVFEAAFKKGYQRVLNVGCAVGYYAVGLALRMPKAKVEAFDIASGARDKCADMVRLNGVEDRVTISGEMRGEDFAKYADEKTLVVMDIEGAEKALLDPEKFPALKKMDVIVELHDLFDNAISPTLIKRFEPTHTIEIIKNRNALPNLDKLLPDNVYLDPYDHFLLSWEGRDGGTPWGVFLAKDK